MKVGVTKKGRESHVISAMKWKGFQKHGGGQQIEVIVMLFSVESNMPRHIVVQKREVVRAVVKSQCA